MKHAILGALGLAVVAASGAEAAPCDQLYTGFINGFSAGPGKDMTAPHVAAVNRLALRGYDSCYAGDAQFSQQDFWRNLERQAYAKDWSSDFWDQQDRQRYAK